MLKFIEIIEMTENRENEWVKGNGVVSNFSLTHQLLC
jgi:hypothetical protein